jgi:hypothetical protein
MNIFFLDRDPARAARFHSDVHVVKMVLETAQILCAVLHRYHLPAPYKPTHAGHPCVLWAGDSLPHYLWTRRLGLELAKEYRYRRARDHASEAIIQGTPKTPPIPDLGWTEPAQAMPELYRGSDPVAAYRAYYAETKNVFPGKGSAIWSRRHVPGFMLSFILGSS